MKISLNSENVGVKKNVIFFIEKRCENVMKRTIVIPTLNDGKEFEIPERKVKHTRYVLQKTAKIEDESMKGYELGYHTAYIILKDILPKIEYADIDNLTDDELTKISNIIWGEVSESGNFPNPKTKKTTEKNS